MRGRPLNTDRKVMTSIRLDADLLNILRDTGPGYQSRINSHLRWFAGLDGGQQWRIPPVQDEMSTETDSTDSSVDQGVLAVELATELTDVLRKMSQLDGIGERSISQALSDMEDHQTLANRMGTLRFLYNPNVDHTFKSYELRCEPDDDHPEGEIETSKALSLLLLNEVIFLNNPHWMKEEESQKLLWMGVNCNDVFAWGCSDVEDITYAQIDEVFTMWEKDPIYGHEVWCMIQRKQLPQGPVYRRIMEQGIWDLDAIAKEHSLRANHYDGISMVQAKQKYEVYTTWEQLNGKEPRPFDKGWWEGWREYIAANPSWHDETWKTEEVRRRQQWQIENGYKGS